MHTPGPWTINTDYLSAINAGEKHIAMVNFFKCADKNQRVDEVEHESNARLIAAAPDLLAACEAALAHIEYYSGTLRPAVNDLIDMLTAAIAKAKGE